MTPKNGPIRLIGREGELASLGQALERSGRGELTTVLIGGEAGVGKTRLVEEFVRAEAAKGATTLIGHCLDLGEQGLPFAPFVAALRSLVRRDGVRVFAGHERRFTSLLPELEGGDGGDDGEPLVTGGGGARARATGPLGEGVSRGHLFSLVADVLTRLSSDRGLILVIEDLHWSDRSTRDLIDFLVRASSLAGTLLLITYRSDELHRGHPLRLFLGELDRVRGVERLHLRSLDRRGTAALLAELCGFEPTGPDIDTVHARAQGNPFFTEQLVESGNRSLTADLPWALRDLLLSRIDHLPQPVQRLLRLAAAGGVRINHALLVTVSETGEPELEESLRVALAAQLLVAGPEGEYEFRHALVQEAIHEDLLPGERARLHARYARAIQDRPELVTAGRAPADLAHHWYVARDSAQALVAAYTAADDARRRCAYAEASQLLERVLDLWEQVPDAAGLLGIDHLRVLEEAGETTFDAGEFARCLALSRAALDEVDVRAQPLRKAFLLQRRGRLLRTLGKGDGLRELRLAYELASGVDDPVVISMISELVVTLAKAEQPEWESAAVEVAAAAARIGDPVLENLVRLDRLRVRRMDVPVGQAVTELREVVEYARSAGDTLTLVRGMVCLSDALFELGDYQASQEVAASGRADATRFGISRSAGPYLVSNQAEALIALGRWDEGDELCSETALLDPPSSYGVHWQLLRANLWLARRHPGAQEMAARATEHLAKPFLRNQLALPLRALRIDAAVARGCRQSTIEAVRAGLAMERIWTHPRYAWALLARAAEALCGVRDWDAASRGGSPPEEQASEVGLLIDRVASLADRIPVRYPAERAHAAQVRALVSGPERELADWRAAVAAWRADGQPYPLARALFFLSGVEAGQGDRSAAGRTLAEAMAIADRLGARQLSDRIRVLGRRLGVPTVQQGDDDGGRAENGRGTLTLTTREREVLRLVCEGASNRQIAGELFISPKTASAHVSHILAKLRVNSRGEAAAVARHLDLSVGPRP